MGTVEDQIHSMQKIWSWVALMWTEEATSVGHLVEVKI